MITDIARNERGLTKKELRNAMQNRVDHLIEMKKIASKAADVHRWASYESQLSILKREIDRIDAGKETA